MKNLQILNQNTIITDGISAPDLNLIDTCFDLISDSLTIILSNNNLIEFQQLDKFGNLKILSIVEINDSNSIIKSIAHLEDINQFIIILSNGDIISSTYDGIDENNSIIEIIGTIDAGILSAKWSYDEEILTLITNDYKLLLFSRNLDLILETSIDSNDIKSFNNQVSIGWGKEETQFKGKGKKQLERDREILKNAGLNIDSENAILCDPTISFKQMGKLTEFDLKNVSISWRGDCQFFSISIIEEIDNLKRRSIRVYSRDGQLISISEPIDGHEHSLAWKPQGSIIVSTQRKFDSDPEINDYVLDIIFFEKNGLRHGEFNSRLNPLIDNILNIDWSSNSEILLLQLENSIQLWYVKNYHWYLKQEIKLNSKIKFTKFHPEKPFKLIIGTYDNNLKIIDFSYINTIGSTSLNNDKGVSLVIDGNNCMLTPFAKANVPPPISYRDIFVNDNIISNSISSNNKFLAILTNNKVTLFENSIEDTWNFNELNNFDIDPDYFVRQILIVDKFIYILFDEENNSKLLKLNLLDVSFNDIIELNYKVIKISYMNDLLFVEYINGQILNIIDNSIIGQFPEICYDFKVVNINTEEEFTTILPIGLTISGKLYSNNKLISNGVTSMLTTDSYLLFTTAQHELKFINLNNEFFINDEEFVITSNDNNNDNNHDERIRSIERGSILVNSCPSKSLVILQAPRGNLETIYPRILVLNDIRLNINKLNYYNAFMICRTHRISLDILHDYNPELFFNNLKHFINQLGKVEYLDLFISCLLEEDVCQTKYKETEKSDIENPHIEELITDVKKLKLIQFEKGKEKVRKICDSILEILINNVEYKEKYLQSIITAYASQKPPRAKEALELISTFTNDLEIEKSVQHLCFLLDINKLYDIALSIYNIPLALIIAQQSQKDPKEYLPFLQKLYEESELRMKFSIDNYLKNYSKALESLIKIPIKECSNIQDEIIDYIIDNELYKHALKLYKYDEINYNLILKFFASYLHSNQKYSESAIIYEKLKDFNNALENYILGKNWREAITISLMNEFKDKLEDTCNKLIDSLTIIHDYKSAAYISYKYLNNLSNALELYGKEYEYSTAIQLCYEENQLKLIETIIDPSINEGFATIAELLADCNNQIISQMKRLKELREKKLNDPYSFYGEINEENTPDNVSIAPSIASTKESFFTRYTGKTSGTAKTGASRRTAKNKRREERKKARGKKGTIYEEEYLISSIGRLIDRLEVTKPDTIKLLNAMIKRNMIEKAYIIQSNFINILQLLKDNVVEIYTVDKRDRERIDDNGIIYYVDEIPVPTIKDFPVIEMLDY